MLELQAVEEGTVIAVRVQAGARRTAIRGQHGGQLRVAVTASPERGKANTAVVRLMAESLGLGRGRVEIVQGHGSRDKKVLVRGLTPQQVRKALDVHHEA